MLGDKVFPTSTTGWGARTSMLRKITVHPGNEHFRSESGILCSANGEIVFCAEQQGSPVFTIPDYITAVHAEAFRGNAVIRKLIIPETVKELDARAFSGMAALEEVVFTGNRETLGKELFYECPNLKQIAWPEGLKTIGLSCFEASGLEQVSIPESVEVIESYAFAITRMQSVTLPPTVKKIGMSIFAHVKDITVYDTMDADAKPPCDGLDSNNGFCNGRVGFIGIYQRKNYIAGACNANWYEHTITVRSAETGEIKYAVRMPYDQKRKVYCTYASAWGKDAGFHFPAIDALFKELTADAKQDYALARMGQWDSLSDEMKDTLSKYIARNAKDLCAKVMENDDAQLLALMESCGIVKKNTIDERLEQADKYGAVSCKAWLLEWQNKALSPKEKAKKADSALKMRAPTVAEIKKIWPHKKGADGGLIITGYNGKDVDAVVPEVIGKTPVTGIASSAFSDSKDPQQQAFLREQLRSVVIPDSVKTIGHMAFYCCSGLESVKLPKDLEVLEGNLFRDCGKLSVTIPKKARAIMGQALAGAGNTVLEIPGKVSSIDPAAFVPTGWHTSYTTALKEFRVDPKNTSFKAVDGVLFSGDGATLVSYPGAKDDDTYTVPDGVTAIAENAFRHNLNLKHIVLPDTVTRIDAYAFAGCHALETIVMPRNLEALGSSAFSESAALKEITVPEGISALPSSAFQICTALTTVHLPKNLKRIDSAAFDRCPALTAISIPEGLKGIGEQAFRRCTSLKTLRFSEQTTKIGYAAFSECPELTIHAPEGSKVYEYAKNHKLKVVTD